MRLGWQEVLFLVANTANCERCLRWTTSVLCQTLIEQPNI